MISSNNLIDRYNTSDHEKLFSDWFAEQLNVRADILVVKVQS